MTFAAIVLMVALAGGSWDDCAEDGTVYAITTNPMQYDCTGKDGKRVHIGHSFDNITEADDPPDASITFRDAPLNETVNVTELLDCLKWMRARVTCRNCQLGWSVSVTDVQPFYIPPAEALRQAAKEIEAHDAKLKECDGVIERLEKVVGK